MNRGKKLIRNLAVILVLLLGFYYFGGYYVSRQQCIIETLRGLYGTETREIMELRQGNYIATLMADEDDESFSIVGTKKIGFLYRTGSSSIGIQNDKKEILKISGMASSDHGMVIFLCRNNKTIEKVEVLLENGESFTITEWQEDYAGYIREDHNWESGTYKAYNAEGELVGEVYY